MTKVNIKINGVEVEADSAQPLIRACHDSGVDVPMYCYHPGLSPVGSCRICQVEVKQGEMPPRVMVACRTPVAEGMEVNTEAPGAHDARRECLEFLLKNHPLDCPICDKAGECDLQDFTFNEGQAESRTVEPRRKLDKRKDLGDVIVLDEERCILCSRCVRFMEEVPKTPQLTVSGLASRSTISTFMDRPLNGNYQGNLADVCPVGALTLKKFRFQARVWNLRKSLSTCSECSRGCSTLTEVLRDGEVKRIRPRENTDVNQYWMCDHGRFSFDVFNAEGRTLGAQIRGYQGTETVDIEDGLNQVTNYVRVHAATAAVLVSPFVTQEEAASIAALCDALGARKVFVSPPPSDLKDDVLHTGDPCPNRKGLEELGFEGLSAADALATLDGKELVLLCGERIGAHLGDNLLEGLTSGQRAVLFDTHPLEHAAIKVCFGVPYSIEKNGSFLNVDGKRGMLTTARPAPSGVVPLTRLIDALTEAASDSSVDAQSGAGVA